MRKNKIKEIEEILRSRIEFKNKVAEIENKIFKCENEYLEMTQGCSLLRNLEFYIHTKPEKKKTTVEEDDRVFSSNFPGQRN